MVGRTTEFHTTTSHTNRVQGQVKASVASQRLRFTRFSVDQRRKWLLCSLVLWGPGEIEYEPEQFGRECRYRNHRSSLQASEFRRRTGPTCYSTGVGRFTRSIDFQRNCMNVLKSKGNVDQNVMLPGSYRALLTQLSRQAAAQ